MLKPGVKRNSKQGKKARDRRKQPGIRGNSKQEKTARDQRNEQVRKTQEQRVSEKRQRSFKRLHAESYKPTYIQQADLLEEDLQWFTTNLLTRSLWVWRLRILRPDKHITRQGVSCSFRAAEEKPSWSQPTMLMLLGRGPQFIPQGRALSTTEVLGGSWSLCQTY